MFQIARILVNIIFGVIELLLLARFALEFFSANRSTPFVAWIYDVSAPLVAPFVGIFPNWQILNFVVDFTTLIALVVYSLIGYFLMRIFSYAGYYPEDRV